MVAATLRFLEGTGAWVIDWIQAAYAVLRLIGTALAWIFGWFAVLAWMARRGVVLKV